MAEVRVEKSIVGPVPEHECEVLGLPQQRSDFKKETCEGFAERSRVQL